MNITVVMLIAVMLLFVAGVVISAIMFRVWAEIRRQKEEIIAIIDEALGGVPQSEATALHAETSVESAREEAEIPAGRHTATAKKTVKPLLFWIGWLLYIGTQTFAWVLLMILIASGWRSLVGSLMYAIPVLGVPLGVLLILLSRRKLRHNWFWPGSVVSGIGWAEVVLWVNSWVGVEGFPNVPHDPGFLVLTIGAFSFPLLVGGGFCISRGWPRIEEERPSAPIEMHGVAVKKTTGPGSIWAGIALVFIGLGLALFVTILWTGGFGARRIEAPWHQLLGFMLIVGLPFVVPGVYSLRHGIAGSFITSPTNAKVSYWWWLFPVALGFIGGIICWVKYGKVNWRQAMYMLAVGIFLTFPLLAAGQTMLPPPDIDILRFNDNFQDGNADGWQLQLGWQVVSENGNYVLEGQGQDFQRAWPRVTSWDNYVLEADFELLSGLFQFDVRSSGPKASYILWVQEGAVSLGKEASPKPINLDDSKVDIGLKRWHTIGIALEGGSIKVYIDHKLKIDYWDKEPLPAGTFGIKSHPGSQVRVDNIKVTPTSPLPPLTPSPTPTPNLLALSGFVRESATKAPISGAKITVIDHNSLKGPWIQRGAATTDGQGRYVVSGLPSGTCAVQIEARGYATEWFDGIYAKDLATPLIVAAPGERSNIDFALEKGGSISGKVIADASFDSIANLHIFATDYLTNEWIAGVNTSSDGTYTLGGLPAGTYRVRASPSNSRLPYADKFYDSTYDYSAAQQVKVSAGQETTGIKFSLAPGGSISGVVRNANGSAPLANVSVECYHVVNGRWEWWGSWGAVTDSQGKYTIYGMPHGDFSVRAPGGGRWGTGDGDFVQEYYIEKSRQAQAGLVTVASAVNPTDVNFTLSTGGSISGKVIADISQNGIAHLHVYADDHTTGEWMAGTNTGVDGTYTLHGLPAGTYRVKAVPSISKLPYADEFHNNTYDYNSAQAVTVNVGQVTQDIKFSLASGGSVSGAVRNANGSVPLTNVSVECYRVVSGRWESWSAVTDSQGKYAICGLPHGDFGVRAPGGGRSGAGDGDFIQEYYLEKSRQALAGLVTVASGSNPTDINFTLSTGGSISGKVVGDADQGGIANLHVNAEDCKTGEWMSGTSTRADGTYTLHGLPAGDYQVKAAPSNNKQPHADEYYDNTYDHSAAKPVTVTVGQDTPDINFALEVGGSISGRVTDEAGKPIVNSDVWADYWAGSTAGGTRTDADGRYTIKNLPSGDYGVRAKAPGRVQKSYNNAWTYDKATPVHVTAPNDAADINFSLGPGGAISGTVKEKVSGRPLANVSVDCGRVDGEGGGGATTDQNGNYTITGLPFGRYKIGSPSDKRWGSGDDNYARQFYSGKLDWSSADMVTISTQNPNATNINFSLVALR